MIKSPEIPTDNLYKFIAIFGLTIFIASIYFLITTQQNFYTLLEERSSKHSKFLLRDAKNFSKKLAFENRLRIKELFIESKFHFSPSSINNKNALQRFSGNKDLELQLKEYQDLQLALNELNDEISNDRYQNDKEFKRDISNKYLVPIALLASIGFIMILIGFSLWYTKTQKFVDRHLKDSYGKE